MVAGLAAVTVHLLPGLQAPGAHCPLRDVHVYWWGGQQPALGGPPYAPGAPYSFTDPPFAAAVAAGAALLPSQFRVFWLDGVFADRSRIGNPANPSDQSLAGAMARLADGAAAVQPWWLAEVLLTGVAGLRGRRLGAPPRSPAGRGDLLRYHRRADLAVLLDPLGLGRPHAGDADHGSAPASLARLRPGRGRRCLLRAHPIAVAWPPSRTETPAGERPVRAVRPGRAGRRRPGPDPGARSGPGRY